MKVFPLLLLIVFTMVSTHGGILGNLELYDTYGLSLEGIKCWEIWQLVTYSLLHGTWGHVLVNVVLLYFIGRKLNGVLSKRVSLHVALIGCLLGGVSHLLLTIFLPQSEQGLLVGSSGVVMALFLCVTTLDGDRYYPIFRIRARFLGLGFLLSSLILALFTPSLGIPGFSIIGGCLAELIGDEIFYVSHACHFGGGLAGLICAKKHKI